MARFGVIVNDFRGDDSWFNPSLTVGAPSGHVVRVLTAGRVVGVEKVKNVAILRGGG